MWRFVLAAALCAVASANIGWEIEHGSWELQCSTLQLKDILEQQGTWLITVDDIGHKVQCFDPAVAKPIGTTPNPGKANSNAVRGDGQCWTALTELKSAGKGVPETQQAIEAHFNDFIDAAARYLTCEKAVCTWSVTRTSDSRKWHAMVPEPSAETSKAQLNWDLPMASLLEIGALPSANFLKKQVDAQRQLVESTNAIKGAFPDLHPTVAGYATLWHSLSVIMIRKWVQIQFAQLHMSKNYLNPNIKFDMCELAKEVKAVDKAGFKRLSSTEGRQAMWDLVKGGLPNDVQRFMEVGLEDAGHGDSVLLDVEDAEPPLPPPVPSPPSVSLEQAQRRKRREEKRAAAIAKHERVAANNKRQAKDFIMAPFTGYGGCTWVTKDVALIPPRRVGHMVSAVMEFRHADNSACFSLAKLGSEPFDGKRKATDIAGAVLAAKGKVGALATTCATDLALPGTPTIVCNDGNADGKCSKAPADSKMGSYRRHTIVAHAGIFSWSRSSSISGQITIESVKEDCSASRSAPPKKYKAMTCITVSGKRFGTTTAGAVSFMVKPEDKAQWLALVADGRFKGVRGARQGVLSP